MILFRQSVTKIADRCLSTSSTPTSDRRLAKTTLMINLSYVILILALLFNHVIVFQLRLCLKNYNAKYKINALRWLCGSFSFFTNENCCKYAILLDEFPFSVATKNRPDLCIYIHNICIKN